MAGDTPGTGETGSLREPVMKGLLEAVRLTEQCGRAYRQVQGLRAPTVAVFEATRYAASQWTHVDAIGKILHIWRWLGSLRIQNRSVRNRDRKGKTDEQMTKDQPWHVCIPALCSS